MKSTSAISKLLTLKCRESTELLSQSMDGDLSAADRWALRLHLWICRPCRRYRRQLHAIRERLADLAERFEGEAPFPDTGMSDELRARLRAITDADRG